MEKLKELIFAEQFKRALKFRDYDSQSDYARKNNLPLSTVNSWCNGFRKPTLNTLIDVANGFKLRIDYFSIQGADPGKYIERK